MRMRRSRSRKHPRPSRLIDFLSGVAYAQDGKIRRVASATYIITPFNVDLMGDQLDDMESGEFHL